MFDGLVDLLWPRVCPICTTEIDDPDPSALVHGRCIAALPLASPRAGEGTRVHATFVDAPGWFALLHAWKYGGQRRIARIVAAAMAARAPSLDPGAHRLVPVPDDPARLLQRGYSPAGDLARALSRTTGMGVEPGLLRRAQPRRSQTSCRDDAQRRRNVAGVFRTGDLARCARGCTLVLVDDQVTSGATVAEAVRILRARGNPVIVWCAARAARAPSSLA